MNERSDRSQTNRAQAQERQDGNLARLPGPQFTKEQLEEILHPLAERYASAAARRLRLGPNELDDACQELHLRLRRALRKVPGRPELRVLEWGGVPARDCRRVLRRLAELAVLEELRGRRRPADPETLELLEDGGSSPVDEVERRDAYHRILELADAELTGRALSYWRLFFVDRLTVAEIAERFRVSPQRVRESNSRSNARLRSRLGRS